MELQPANAPGPVVLLRGAPAAHGAALVRARALADALGVDLVMARPMPDMKPGVNVLFPHRHWREFAERARRVLRAADARQRWLSLPAVAKARLPVVIFVWEGRESIVDALRCIGPSLVVLPACEAWRGESVAALAAALDVPVLVARRPGETRRVIAASNLEDVRLPVLRQGLTWARRLHADVTFVHNVDAPLAGLGVAGELVSAQPPAAAALPESRFAPVERLADASAAEIAITQRLDPVAGVLSVAKRADADVVVVGAPPRRRGLRGLLARNVARRIVDWAMCSVLVVPPAAAWREPFTPQRSWR